MTAAALVATVESRGAHCTLRDGRLVVAPASVIDADLAIKLWSRVREVAALLRLRDGADAALPSSPPPRVACELRRFTDWRPATVVRFCCEPDHQHEDGIPTYDLEECSIIVAWSTREGRRSLPIVLRNALLDVKAAFDGRIVPAVPAPSAAPTGS